MITLKDGRKLWNFDENEFLACTPSCSATQLDDDFLFRLQQVRTCAGIPFHLNSAYRSGSYDLSKGRTGNSFHCKGRAVDIRCVSSENRYKIVQAAIKCGMNGIGIGPSFIHLDDREEPKIFHYYGNTCF